MTNLQHIENEGGRIEGEYACGRTDPPSRAGAADTVWGM